MTVRHAKCKTIWLFTLLINRRNLYKLITDNYWYGSCNIHLRFSFKIHRTCLTNSCYAICIIHCFFMPDSWDCIDVIVYNKLLIVILGCCKVHRSPKKKKRNEGPQNYWIFCMNHRIIIIFPSRVRDKYTYNIQ